MQQKKFNVYKMYNQAAQDAHEMLAASIHVLNGQKSVKTIALTSCNPREGKTSMAIGLAISTAQAGWKVLLIDADMRKPNAAKRLNEGSQYGLSDYLTGCVDFADAVSETNIPNLTYCSCGADSANPIGLLCSVRFEELMGKVKNEYDFIIFDTPAVATVADATIIASKVDATLLVVQVASTTLKSLTRIKKQLEDVNANILGVVLNRVKKREYKRYLGAYNYFFNEKDFLNNKVNKRGDLMDHKADEKGKKRS
jgi:capsular exopolysaccharide synthesis family protein